MAHKVLRAGQQVVCKGNDFLLLDGVVSGDHMTVEVLVEWLSVTAPVRAIRHEPKAERIIQHIQHGHRGPVGVVGRPLFQEVKGLIQLADNDNIDTKGFHMNEGT